MICTIELLKKINNDYKLGIYTSTEISDLRNAIDKIILDKKFI